MPTRRTLLTTLLATAAAIALPWRAPARPPGIRIVDGWILTDADLAGLARHDP